MIWSAVAALASAALFAGTTNLQRLAASAVAPGGGPLNLMRRLVRDLRWLAGCLIGAVALGLHGLSLVLGSVTVVQSVMALGLLLALGLEALRERRPLRPGELAGSASVVAGVVAVVGTGRPAGPREGLTPAALAVCLLVVVLAVAAVVRSRHEVKRRWGARLLAAAAGACFAVDAVFLQQTAVLVGALLQRDRPVDVTGALIGVAGFLGASTAGGVAVHRAYQVAPLRRVQPALAAAEPVTAFLLGAGLLGEGVRGGAGGFAVLVGGLVAITVGILAGITGGRGPSVAAGERASRPGPVAVRNTPADRVPAGVGSR
jgi:hypothetical protein